jgi:AAA15 family ATPase/GTPase
MKVTNLKIEKFRNLNNVDFRIGKKLTIIAGRNGTGKSSLLGLIGHIFDYKGKSRTLSGQKFATEFNKIFRFSLNREKNSEYIYQVLINDGDKEIVRDAYFNGYNETEKRFRIYVGKKEKAQGKINIPVIYLGLERLFPIAQEKDKDIEININLINLNDEDKKWYKNCYNSIFASEEPVDLEDCKTYHKRFYSASCELHDSFSNSAGEDNLGQILTSILSFKKMKEENDNEKYEGGILLIDELDATLFPGAQIKLLDFFLKFAKEFNLQIIFTTHSTDIIKLIKQNKFSNSEDVEFLFLEKKGDGIIPYQTKKDIEKMLSSLRYEIFQEDIGKKIELYTEDEEARIFLRGIIKHDFRKHINIKSLNFGYANYIHLIKNKVSPFTLSIVILDGDCKKQPKNKNILLLPGGKRPENVFYDLLDSLSPEDNFWGSYGAYNKEYFLANRPKSDNRDDMKQWFNSHKIYWGRGCNNVIKIWKGKNRKEINKFNQGIEDVINYLLFK